MDVTRTLLADRLELANLDHFPDTLLGVPACDLHAHLDGPTLFRIPGRQGAPLFVSVLLHGNEDTGWHAVQKVLAQYRGRPLPRPLLLLVGNVAAARAGVRTLPGQQDYNRAWPGTPDDEAAEAQLMRQVIDIVAAAKPFASIDIHNNTGHNPHYACLNSLAEPYLHLARLFSRTVVYFERPLGVQSAALSTICPAVTVECGRVGGEAGIAHAADFVFAALALSHFPEHPVPEGDIDLIKTFAIIRVPQAATFSFDAGMADFRFRDDIDRLNFAELEPGTSLGRLGPGSRQRLVVVPGDGLDETDEYFRYDDGEIRLARAAVPAMLTRDKQAVRLDCLGYLMHRIRRDGRRVCE